MSGEKGHLPYPGETEARANDHVIGRAFRTSMKVLTCLGVVVGGILVVTNMPVDDPGPAHGPSMRGPEHEQRVAKAPAVRFADITREAGVEFVHSNGATGEKWLPETMGSGCAFLDYDRDGDADLFLVNGTTWDRSRGESSRLYRNDGTGRFHDVTQEVGLDACVLHGMGVATGDADGDGWLDLYVTAYGRNRLYRNVEGKRFEDITETSGVGGGGTQWSSSAAFFDLEGDGDLDLFVCNYVEWSREISRVVDYRLTGIGRAYGPPTNFPGTHSTLYRNEGNGRFTDISSAAGIHVAHESTGRPEGKALAVRPFDLEGDGDVDLFVANDTVRNFFFRNDGNGKFVESGFELGLAYASDGQATGAMGVDFAHYRNDETMGIGVGNFAAEMSSLYVGRAGELVFADEAAVEGIGATSRRMLTFGLFFFDCDLDRRLDLLQVNGHLEEEINRVQSSQEYRQPAQLFWNTGRATEACFVPIDDVGDLTRPIVGRGSSFADIDGDGDLDLLLTQVAGPPLLLRNDQATGHHWLRLRLEQQSPNHHAIGATVTLRVGTTRLARQVMPARGYLSQVELPLTFGLGEATSIDAATITWPDGTVQQLQDLEIDRLHVIRR